MIDTKKMYTPEELQGFSKDELIDAFSTIQVEWWITAMKEYETEQKYVKLKEKVNDSIKSLSDIVE